MQGGWERGGVCRGGGHCGRVTGVGWRLTSGCPRGGGWPGRRYRQRWGERGRPKDANTDQRGADGNGGTQGGSVPPTQAMLRLLTDEHWHLVLNWGTANCTCGEEAGGRTQLSPGHQRGSRCCCGRCGSRGAELGTGGWAWAGNGGTATYRPLPATGCLPLGHPTHAQHPQQHAPPRPWPPWCNGWSGDRGPQ